MTLEDIEGRKRRPLDSYVGELEERLLRQDFKDLNNCFEAYNQYALAMGFSVRKGKQYYYPGTKDPKIKWFYCSCEGTKDEKFNGQTTYCRFDVRTDCQAKISFEKGKSGVWKVVNFVKEHNHLLALPHERHFLRSARCITKSTGNLLETFVNSGIRPVDGISYFIEESGGPQSGKFIGDICVLDCHPNLCLTCVGTPKSDDEGAKTEILIFQYTHFGGFISPYSEFDLSAMAAEKLRDLSQPMDVALLDATVAAFYGTGSKEERTAADHILRDLKNNSDMWLQVVHILSHTQNLKTKYFALQVLEGVIKYRWNALPVEQRDGMKNYISKVIIKVLSSDDISLRRERLYVNKLNIILVQILKHEWPARWRSFIPDLVAAARTSEAICENCMAILKLLSEEVFDFSRGEMTQVKIKELKQSLNSEFQLIHELCLYVLSASQRAELIRATLATLHAFLSWIPLGYIFESQLLQTLLNFFPMPAYRNLTLQCLTEVTAHSFGDFYNMQYVKIYTIFMVQLQTILAPTSNFLEVYSNGIYSKLGIVFHIILQDKYDSILIRFNGKNYSAWAFHFRIFVKGKDLWGHVDGSKPAPDKDKEKDEHAKWEVKDAQIMAWILGSVESSIILNLQPFKTAAEMWNYLKKLYNQQNTARRFQLEHELATLQQGSLSISDFYSSFMNLWAEYSDIVYASLPPEGLASVQVVHEITKRDQFLMKLRSEFEATRSNLMNREPVPSLDTCLNALFREEQRLLTQATMEQQKSTYIPVAYATQGKPKGRDMTTIQCFCCKGFGHYASNCPKKFCNYCKKDGHIIKECPTRPPKKSETAYTASVGSSSAPTTTNVQPVTPEMIQQMIISALSALGVSGKPLSTSSPWYFDSGASHHMTNNVDLLTNVKKYSGNLKIYTADGNPLPITATGDISPSLTNVFVSPGLATNLVSIVQSHIRVLESSQENINALLMGLEYLINISYVNDTEVFKVCLDYWNFLVWELFEPKLTLINPAATANKMGPHRCQLYAGPMSKLRLLMICRMAKPEEVLIVEDENGNIVRETMKDNDVLVQYKIMRETLIYLTHLDYQDTENEVCNFVSLDVCFRRYKF
ncbi:hypothetical protein RD792_000469 [Penstemon davidsonii]|uniref:Uncharacterized protein n=1 Tax=Penstemon davidsonii TaxID=160366 RepID=A0ABR0DKR4_9LAMI|nr:hypothetical protein RD792_000469 [Penstemon davidsonii]